VKASASAQGTIRMQQYNRLSAPRFPNRVYFSLETAFRRSDLEKAKSQPTLLDFDEMMKNEFTG